VSYSNTVFRQMLSMIPIRHFNSEVERSGVDRYTKHYTHVSEDDKKEALKMLPKGFTNGEKG